MVAGSLHDLHRGLAADEPPSNAVRAADSEAGALVSLPRTARPARSRRAIQATCPNSRPAPEFPVPQPARPTLSHHCARCAALAYQAQLAPGRHVARPCACKRAETALIRRAEASTRNEPLPVLSAAAPALSSEQLCTSFNSERKQIGKSRGGNVPCSWNDLRIRYKILRRSGALYLHRDIIGVGPRGNLCPAPG